MENNEHEELNEKHTPNPIETNYEANKANPGPAEEAVTEKNDKPAAKVQRWLLPLIIVILIVLWLILRK